MGGGGCVEHHTLSSVIILVLDLPRKTFKNDRKKFHWGVKHKLKQ